MERRVVEKSMIDISVSVVELITGVVEETFQLCKVGIGLVHGVVVDGNSNLRDIDGVVVVEGVGEVFQRGVDISVIEFWVSVLDFFSL